jgi:hypothetical protein
MTERILEKDPDLDAPENAGLKHFLQGQHGRTQWSRIS